MSHSQLLLLLPLLLLLLLPSRSCHLLPLLLYPRHFCVVCFPRVSPSSFSTFVTLSLSFSLSPSLSLSLSFSLSLHLQRVYLARELAKGVQSERVLMKEDGFSQMRFAQMHVRSFRIVTEAGQGGRQQGFACRARWNIRHIGLKFYEIDMFVSWTKTIMPSAWECITERKMSAAEQTNEQTNKWTSEWPSSLRSYSLSIRLIVRWSHFKQLVCQQIQNGEAIKG